jgi:hypothetical protein
VNFDLQSGASTFPVLVWCTPRSCCGRTNQRLLTSCRHFTSVARHTTEEAATGKSETRAAGCRWRSTIIIAAKVLACLVARSWVRFWLAHQRRRSIFVLLISIARMVRKGSARPVERRRAEHSTAGHHQKRKVPTKRRIHASAEIECGSDRPATCRPGIGRWD